jgi:hypothetical protein
MLGLIERHPLLSGYQPTEIGRRVIKILAITRPGRILLGYLDPDASHAEYLCYIHLACILASPDFPIVTKKNRSFYLSGDELDSISTYVLFFGDIWIEFITAKTPHGSTHWETCAQFWEVNETVEQLLIRVKESLRTHFERPRRALADPDNVPVSTDGVFDLFGIICRVLQSHLSMTQRSDDGGTYLEHYASGYRFHIDPGTFFDWNTYFAVDEIDMLYTKLSKIGSTYVASRLFPILYPSKEAFLKSQNLENKTDEELVEYLAIGMTGSPE